MRLSPGADLSGKLLNLGSGFSQAMESIAPSFHPADLLVGLIGAVVIRLISKMECIILTVNNTFIDTGGYAHEQLQ